MTGPNVWPTINEPPEQVMADLVHTLMRLNHSMEGFIQLLSIVPDLDKSTHDKYIVKIQDHILSQKNLLDNVNDYLKEKYPDRTT